MIIRPSLSTRIFSGTVGTVLFLLACVGLTVPVPGLIFTIVGLPLAVFAFGFAFGMAQTRVDEEGIVQRGFFLRSRKLTWKAMEGGRIVSEEYRDQQSAAGWIEYRTRTLMEFKGSGTTLRILANSSGPRNWWAELRQIAKQKLGDAFDG